MNMTLNQLAARLNEIIEQNKRSGKAERNDLPVVVEINPPPRQKGQHYKNSKSYAIRYAGSAMSTLLSKQSPTGKINVMCLVTNESDRIE